MVLVVADDATHQAITSINDGELPFGVYVFGEDRAQIDRVLDETSSGGALVNTCAVQSTLSSMGFDGRRMSGIGHHHGIEGFREFSNPRGIVERGTEEDMIDAFYAPYAKAGAIADAIFAPQE